MKKRHSSLVFGIVMALALTGCSKIEIGSENVELKIGESFQLEVTTSDTPITCESADSSIAAVDSNGTITAVDVGSTTINVTNSKGKAAECTVNVSHIQPEKIEFSETELILALSQSTSLDVVFSPENTTNHALYYSIAETDIASVDENGTVTAVSVGTTTLTATAADATGVTAACSITILPFAERITIEPSLTLVKGVYTPLEAKLVPDNCYPEEILWTSSDESIVKIVDGKVIGLNYGTAAITAETTETHLTTSCTVTVTPPPLIITGLSMSRSASVAGSMYQISYNISANAAGGSGSGYSYKFDILQNGSVSKSSGWTKNGISGSVSGNGTCELRVTVKDSSGATVTETYDMLR